MKVVETQEATRTLAEYASEIKSGTVVITDHGQPIAALVAIENADLETVSLSTNPQSFNLIERSRVSDEGGVSSEEMRRRLE